MSWRVLPVALLFASVAAAQAPLVAPTDHRSPEDERKGFKLPPGFSAQLVASEPDILKPMQLAFDLKGRLWVTMSQEYPWAAIGRPGKDRLMVLSDFDANGKARKTETFADGLNIPIGLLPLPDGKTVLVSSIDPGPDGGKENGGCWIWEVVDIDGDGKADVRNKLFGPFGTRDTHGMVNSFTLMPDGWVYACHGFANDSKVKGRDGHEVVMNSGNTFRFRPDGSRIEVFTRGQVNPFGIAVDSWFNLYTADCHSKAMTQLIRGATYESFGKPHDGIGFGPDMIRHDHDSTGLCGLACYEAEQFPKDFRGGMFLGNVVTSRINWDKIKLHGSTPEAVAQPDFLVSDDLWFRPVDIKLGPDGALWVSDFYNKIIGHYEVDLKHPGRDRTSGRIWRIVHSPEGKPVPPPIDVRARTDKELDELLGHKNLALRMQATHAWINPVKEPKEDNVLEKQVEEVSKDEMNVHEAHRLWAREAEPVGRGPQWERMKYARHAEDRLTAVHRIKLEIAEAEWEAKREREKREIEKLREKVMRTKGENGHLARATFERMYALPKPENAEELVDALRHVPKEDTHLRHAAKLALRETLRDPAGLRALRQMKVDDAGVRAIGPVLLALPTNDAAGYVAAKLPALVADHDQAAKYVAHASRHGDGHKAVFAFVTSYKPDDVRLSTLLFHAYLSGLQQKGGVRTDDADADFAGKLVAKGLREDDAATVQRCCDIALGLRIKPAAVLLMETATRKDRGDAPRGSAIAALINLEPEMGVKVAQALLTSDADPLPVREKAAQALAAAGSPEASDAVVKSLQAAPARLQTSIALAMAGNQNGAKHLLTAVAEGKASARLLQDRAVQTKLKESRLPGATEQVAKLTAGLHSVDEKMNRLMGERRTGFGKAKPDALLGAAVFKTNCANCHQVAGQGAKVAPALDGIGSRGLDRLLEDILDPSRNVDQALRATTLYLKNEKTISGLVLREEGELIVLADAQGKEMKVPKSEVDDKKTSLLSPMPANLAELIKEEDFHHLMAYLLQQKPKE